MTKPFRIVFPLLVVLLHVAGSVHAQERSVLYTNSSSEMMQDLVKKINLLLG